MILGQLLKIFVFISDKSRFVVSGFGQEKWPVSVDTDLPIFLEQLPDLLKSIESRKNFRLDFYEQGVERYLSFILSDAEYSISCISFTGGSHCHFLKALILMS